MCVLLEYILTIWTRSLIRKTIHLFEIPHWQSLHPLLRTSQVSLSSNPETDFRYSAIYGTIGVYKGRIFAIKMVNKKSIDMTRPMKKELKWVYIHDQPLCLCFNSEPHSVCVCHRAFLFKLLLISDDSLLHAMISPIDERLEA